MLSWEIDSENEYTCPCGKGKYKVISRSDDWNRTEEQYIMLCEECREKYYYSHEIIGGHKGDFIEKGWTLKNETKNT